MMSEQPKSTQLSPEEWKQLCVLNAKQLFDYINNLPSMARETEESPVISGMTPQHIAAIEAHITRGSQFLNAWARSKPVQEAANPAQPQATANAANNVAAQLNGAEPPRQKRKYTKRARPAVQQAVQ